MGELGLVVKKEKPQGKETENQYFDDHISLLEMRLLYSKVLNDFPEQDSRFLKKRKGVTV
jgi:hypothetical protein